MPKKQKAQTASQKSMSIVKNLKVFTDGKCVYAQLERQGNRVRVVPIFGSDFTQWFICEHFKKFGKFPSTNVQQGVVSILWQQAQSTQGTKQLHKRFAQHGGNYYIDLGVHYSIDAISISAGAWTIEQPKDVHFATEPHLEAISAPQKGGDASALLKYLNIDDELQQLMVLVWLAALPVIDIEHPILLLRGVHASGKTSAGEFIRAVFDPARPLKVSTSKKDDELALAFYKNPVSFFDNYSKMNDATADMFCKAVTGEGYTKRKLYHDTQLIHLDYKRPVILSSIDQPSSRLDFRSRCLEIPMNAIPQDKRIGEKLLCSKFEEELPDIRGGLLNVLSEALAIRDKIKVVRKTRMTDFDELGAAITMALGKNPNKFIEARLAAEREALFACADKPVFKAFFEMVNDAGGALQEDMQTMLADINTRLAREGEPSVTDKALGRQLGLKCEALKQANISIHKKRSIYTIRHIVPEDAELVQFPKYCGDCVYGEGNHLFDNEFCIRMNRDLKTGGMPVRCPEYAFDEVEWEAEDVESDAKCDDSECLDIVDMYGEFEDSIDVVGSIDVELGQSNLDEDADGLKFDLLPLPLVQDV